MTREQIKQMVELHTNNVGGNGNVFCTSLELAEITGKQHKHVLIDIEEMWHNVKDRLIFASANVNQYNGGGALTFEGTLNNQQNVMNPSTFRPVSNNQGFVGDPLTFQSVRNNQHQIGPVNNNSYYVPIQEINYNNFRVLQGRYMDEKGEQRKVYYMDEVFYLTMMSKYSDVIRYYMALFYVETVDSIPYTLEDVQKITEDSFMWEEIAYAMECKRFVDEGCMRWEESIPDGEGGFKDIGPIYPTQEVIDDANESIAINKRNFERMEGYYSMKHIFDGVNVEMPNRPGEDIDYYSDTIYISAMTGKEHFHVLRDIRTILSNLEKGGVVNTDVSNRFKESTYLDKSNRRYTMYELDKVAFLTLMGRYYPEINYKLAEFYVEHRDEVISYNRLTATDDMTVYEALYAE